MDTQNTDRDPVTGAPKGGKEPWPTGADEGGVKTGEDAAPVPSNQPAPGEKTSEADTDPSIAIESINGEHGADRAGGMIGEGGD